MPLQAGNSADAPDSDVISVIGIEDAIEPGESCGCPFAKNNTSDTLPSDGDAKDKKTDLGSIIASISDALEAGDDCGCPFEQKDTGAGSNDGADEDVDADVDAKEIHCSCAACSGGTATVTGGGDDRAGVAIVGGREYVVGGWAEYEADRRVAAKVAPTISYSGRTVIGASDVVSSLGNATAVRKSAEQLSSALKNHTENSIRKIGGGEVSVVISPALTSGDVDALIEDPHNPEILADIADSVAGITGDDAITCDLPVMPARAVSVSDASAVRRLEASMKPYMAALEKYQAAVASRLDKAAKILSK